MAISRDEVLHIASLGRLRLSEDEVESYQGALNDILSYVDKLSELDTTDVEPTTHAVPTAMRLREDQVEQRLSLEDCLRNAPATENGMFRVPKIVDAG